MSKNENRDQNSMGLARARRLLKATMGYEELSLDATKVPAAFRALTAMAAQFGCGDDGCREEALAQMPPKFRRELAEDVERHRGAINAWAAEGEFILEKSAFVALTQSLWTTAAMPAAHSSGKADVSAFLAALERDKRRR